MKQQKTLGCGILIVMLLSVVLLCIWTEFAPETFLIDDNRTQWYPVMERAYEDVLQGKIYYYDFYQMKGMSVAEQGYYGIMNPLMLLSYCIAHYTGCSLSTITVYIMMLFLLGNLFFYLLCTRIGCSGKLAVLMTLSYSTAGCFAAFFCWYYVYNNYFIIPFLLYVFLVLGEQRAGYFACGVVLALDIYLGNAQYTCYHYMIFCILCVGLAACKRFRYLRLMCSNVILGLLLSAPLLILLLEASGDFAQSDNFLEYPVFLFTLLLHSAIPHGILHRLGLQVQTLGVNVMSRRDNLVLYIGAPFVVVLLYLAVVVRRLARSMAQDTDCDGTNRKTHVILNTFLNHLRQIYRSVTGMCLEKQMMIVCVVIVLFFLSFAGGGMVAIVLSHMPVIQNFRYLFKTIFIIVPLVNVIAAFLLSADGLTTGLHRAALILTAAFVCLGVCNTYYTLQETNGLFDMRLEQSYPEEIASARQMLLDADVDYKNYRTATYLKFEGVNDELFDCSRNLTKNYATGVGAFALAGYEIATPQGRLEEFGALYAPEGFLTTYGNADNTKNLYDSLTEQPEEVQRQLIDNGVRYLLVDVSAAEDNKMVMQKKWQVPDKDYEEEVIAELEKLPLLAVSRVTKLNEHYDLIELSGVHSLCVDADGHMVPVTDTNMQTLTFEAEQPGSYRLAFSYDSHLTACLYAADGTVVPLAVSGEDNGTILIDTQGLSGTVCLTYENPVCRAAFAFELVTGVLFVGVVVWICKNYYLVVSYKCSSEKGAE